jgi:hypothetical protein
VALLLRNNFSSGPVGTTITTVNSGNGDDDAWAAVGKTGSGVAAYDASPDRPTAEFVGKLLTTTPTGTAVLAWGTAGFAQIYVRMYVYFSVLPNNPGSPVIFYCETVGGLQAAVIGVNGSSPFNIIIEDAATSFNSATTTGGITAAQWFRIEARFKFGTPTAGEIDLKWFDDPDSDTPTETLSVTGWDLKAATAANFYFGYVFTDTTLEALRLSGIELNDSGFPGPLPFKQKSMPGYQPSSIAVHNDVF